MKKDQEQASDEDDNDLNQENEDSQDDLTEDDQNQLNDDSSDEDSSNFDDNQSYNGNNNEDNDKNDLDNDYSQNNEDNNGNDNENNNANKNDGSDEDDLDNTAGNDENNNDNEYGNDNQLQGEVNDSDQTDSEYQIDYNENKSEKEINEFDMEALEKDIRKMLVMEGREKEKFYGSRVDSKSEKGKYVKSKYSQKVSSSDIAVDATLRAAAMRSKKKDLVSDLNTEDSLNSSNSLKANIKSQDIREKVRKHKARASIAIVVDMSGSMISEKKVNKIRGILDRIIKNINRNRDKLSVIGFKGQGSEIIIPNTKRPSSFLDKLDKITVGGTTPMAAGLEKALEILKDEKKKGEFIPMLILLSDGMPNIGLKDSSLKKTTGSPVNDVLAIGEELAEVGIYTIIIDFEKKHKHGRNINMELAFLANGRYYDIKDVYNPDIAIDKILTYERNVL